MKPSVKDLELSSLELQSWCRAVKREYAKHPLWWEPSERSRQALEARFKARRTTFALLHFAWDENTALLEAGAMKGTPDPMASSADGWVTVRVSVRLDRVADLRGMVERRKVGTTAQELTGDWRAYGERTGASLISSVPPAPTQRFGEVLYAGTECQAFLTPSAKNPLFPNLVVFPRRTKIDEATLTIAPS